MNIQKQLNNMVHSFIEKDTYKTDRKVPLSFPMEYPKHLKYKCVNITMEIQLASYLNYIGVMMRSVK